MINGSKQSRRSFLRTVGLTAGAAVLAVSRESFATTTTLELGTAPAADIHRVATCNILLDLSEHKGTPLDWKSGRKEVCIESIRAYKASIICLQEVGAVQQKDFEEAFSEYDSFGFYGPVSDRNPDRFLAIRNVTFYAKERYRLMGAGGYTLSETPLIDGSALPENRLGRHVNWVRLQDKATGRHFRVLNTHLSLKSPHRQQETAIIAPETAQYGDDFLQILCGDLNSRTPSKEQAILQEVGWQDSYTSVLPMDPVATSKIDFIYTRGGVQAVSTKMIREQRKEIPASDHPFVIADLRFP